MFEMARSLQVHPQQQHTGAIQDTNLLDLAQQIANKLNTIIMCGSQYPLVEVLLIYYNYTHFIISVFNQL